MFEGISRGQVEAVVVLTFDVEHNGGGVTTRRVGSRAAVQTLVSRSGVGHRQLAAADNDVIYRGEGGAVVC